MIIIDASYSNVSVTYTADGTQKVFSFPFDYLRKAFVKVEINWKTLLTQGDDYSVSDNKTVVLTETPEAGSIVRIFRETTTTRLVSWADASVLRAKDMTVQQVQELHLLEELKGWAEGYALLRDGNEWDAKGFIIKNVGDPVKVHDAATKNYVDTLIAEIVAQGNNVIFINTAKTMIATNISAGVYVVTAGYDAMYDGGNAVYSIRPKDYFDKNDGKFIIFLNNGNVAERMGNIGVTNGFEVNSNGELCQII